MANPVKVVLSIQPYPLGLCDFINSVLPTSHLFGR
jgi:hypothetical protein